MAATNKRIVYVGGLSEEVDDKVLYSALVPFGEITDINIPLDYETEKHRGFAFVEFELAEDAAACLDNMNDSELFGRTIRVNLAKPMKIKEGATRAVWSEDSWLQQHAGETVETGVGDGDAENSTGQSVETTQTTTTATAKTVKNVKVYLEMRIGARNVGRVVCELYSNVVPKTAGHYLRVIHRDRKLN